MFNNHDNAHTVLFVKRDMIMGRVISLLRRINADKDKEMNIIFFLFIFSISYSHEFDQRGESVVNKYPTKGFMLGINKHCVLVYFRSKCAYDLSLAE